MKAKLELPSLLVLVVAVVTLVSIVDDNSELL